MEIIQYDIWISGSLPSASQLQSVDQLQIIPSPPETQQPFAGTNLSRQGANSQQKQ